MRSGPRSKLLELALRPSKSTGLARKLAALCRLACRRRSSSDSGPPDAGPASGGILLFFLADGASEEEMRTSVDVLADAVDADMARLQERSSRG
jgi:hypothetical protein